MQGFSTKTTSSLPPAGPGAWTPSPSILRSPAPVSGPSMSASSISTLPHNLHSMANASSSMQAIAAMVDQPAAPFPLRPLEEIIGYRIPTPSPEPEIIDPPKFHPSSERKRNGAARRSPLPRAQREDSDEPIMLLEAPSALRPPRIASQSATSSWIDPSKVEFDPLHQPLPPEAACRIVRYPGKGLGLQATRDVRRGEEVIREKPFFKFTHPITSIELYERRRQLALRERALFLSFTGTVNDEPDEWVNIAETNCIDLRNGGDDDESIVVDELAKSTVKERWAGLFEYICRINHSCAPNTRWHWDEEGSQLVLLACYPIAQGDEITASYKNDEVFLSRDARRTALEHIFGFTCTCSQCTLPDALQAASDARLARYRHIKALWSDDIRDFAFDRGKALVQLHEAEGILRLENKEAWKGELLEHKFYIHALWAQRTLAIEAGRRARRWSEILDGKQRTWERDLARLADFPEEYEGWGLSLQDNGGVLSEDEDGQSDFEEHHSGNKQRKTKQRSKTSHRTRAQANPPSLAER